MGDIYEIECLDCGHKIEVFEGCGMITQHKLFYCPKCGEITTTYEDCDYMKPNLNVKKNAPVCKTCSTKLTEFEITGAKEIQASIPIKCNKCKSKNIKITETGMWD